NHADAMLNALLPLQKLAAAGPAVLVNHHPRKQGSADGLAARGSGALAACVDALAEVHWYDRASGADRRRPLPAGSRCDETPRQLVIELNEAGTDYASRGDFADDALRPAEAALRAAIGSATVKLSRREVLDRWPAEQPRPAPSVLWELLERAVRRGELKRDGPGLKNDPFHYWLPALEELWQSDLMLGCLQQASDAARAVRRNLPASPFERSREDE